MSATNRGAQRRSKDDYPTPPNHTRALLTWLKKRGLLPAGCSIVDPCAGAGAILRVVREQVPDARLIANELDLGRFEELYEGTLNPDVATFGDALDGAIVGPGAAMITNFPFSLNDAFIERYVTLDRPFSAAFLPVSYLGSSGRCAGWEANPPAHLLMVDQRPQFVAVCKGFQKTKTTTRIKGCGRMYDIGTRGTCACGGAIGDGSDAMVYVWAVWIGQTLHEETRWSWLRVPR